MERSNGDSSNLGGNILRRFTMIIDYAKNQLTLEPNEHLNEPFYADASGLLLEAVGPDFRTFVVKSVVPDSAASESGLQRSDRITAVDGRTTANYALWQLQDVLTPGAIVTLTVQRGGTTFVRRLKLRSLV